ncbi:MAG: SdrD B-like domain-containing protein, partial [Pseudomonadota bacterium]|nr:SdrD B-like domain-containing protein [Pseudomonadota bacterium]
ATDANGNYLFENLEAGDYKVDFDLPAGTFGFTTQDVGDDALDSDADASGQTATITLAAGENNLTVDAGIIDLNTAPEPVADEAMTCADQVKTVDVLANDFDFDGDTLIITKVDGQAIAEGQTITTSAGTLVTLTGGELVIDGEAAYAALDIGEKDVEVISYTVADGNGGTATTDLTMTFCGDANTLESFCASLPETMDYQIVSDQTFPLDPAAFELKISNSGDARLDGVIFENAYCLSFYEEVAEDDNYTDAPMNSGTVLCSTDADVASVFNPNQISVFNGNTAAENMDLINWILNQNFEGNGYSGWEVQRAIWELTDDRDLGYMDNVEDMGEDVNVQEILNLASAHEGYVPSMGGNIGLIVDPGDANELNLQPFIVSVNIEQYDCLC